MLDDAEQAIAYQVVHAPLVSRVVLKLPTNWGGRTQTIAVSVDGSPLVDAPDHLFDPDTGNAVTITLPAIAAQEITLAFTENAGWPAAQISEFEVYSK